MQAVIEHGTRKPVLPSFPDYGICILESRHGKGFTMQPSRYDFSEVMLVLEGRGWIVRGGVRHPLVRRDVMVVPAGDSYFVEDNTADPLAILCLCLRPPPGQQGLWKGVLPDAFARHRHAPLAGEVITHLRAILYEQSQPRGDTAGVVTAHSLMLLSKIRRKGRTPAAHSREVGTMARVRDYLRQLEGAFHETETIAAAAARLGISPKTLTGHFRAITGTTRQRYIRDLRVAHACRLLADSRQSVTSVSFACGFEDISTFFRAFRAVKRMSPSQWRSRSP